MDSIYYFRIVPPEERTNVVIRQEDAEGLLLAASFAGERIGITGKTLTKILARFPLLTLKVTIGIHWEALQLWIKGLRFIIHKPADNLVESSIGRPTTKRR